MSLDIAGIVVSLGEREILHGVDLRIEDGELFSLLGPSGCGKTTLLKTIAGLIEQDAGSVSIDERCLNGLPPEKRDISVIFQEMRLFPNMSVAQNVAFPLKMRGVKKKERLEQASEMLARVQLDGYGDRRITQLSGGQQQRVALARAIVAHPKVLLLDEPFSALDENLRDDMRDLLTMLHGKLDMTMVLVTHDQNEALKLSDRIAIMEEGHVLQCDTPQRIYDEPASLEIARYFSDANIVEGYCTGGVFSCALFSTACALPDGKAVAMLRQRALSLEGDGAGEEFRLAKMDYLGDWLKLVAVREGIALELEVDAQEGYEVGGTLRLAIDPQRALIFPG